MSEQNALLTLVNRFLRSSEETAVAAPTTTRLIQRKPAMVDRLVFLQGTDPFDIALVKMKMDKMFRSSFFSVCEVTEAVSFLKLSTSDTKHTLDRLKMVHCIHWEDMNPDLKQLIPEMISEVLTEGAYISVPSGVVSVQ